MRALLIALALMLNSCASPPKPVVFMYGNWVCSQSEYDGQRLECVHANDY